MDGFIDPRLDPEPRRGKPPARTTPDPDRLAELHRLCREGRLYDIERWIRAGRPLQISQDAPPRRRRTGSALAIALEDESHALTLLLLCNGYDPNLEPSSPLDLALQARRWDLLDLLLQWGADPKEVDLGALYDTYNSRLWERFRGLGVDLTAGNALASALAYHTSNKPGFGFAKRHREHDPKIQQALNIALGYHVEKGSEKGVQLCLWAGADPHAPAPDLGDAGDDDGEEEGEGSRIRGFSAMCKACLHGRVEVLRRLGPDPERDDFEDLYHFARSGAVIELLAGLAPPRNVGALIQVRLWPLTIRLDGWGGEWEALETLRTLFRTGARWEDFSKEGIAGVRHQLLKTSDHAFVEVMKLLAEDDHCAPEILRELARTPSMRTRMQKVGFIPSSWDGPRRFEQCRPTRSREVRKKFGVELPKPPTSTPHLPHTVRIGPWRQDGHEIRMGRVALFERVWADPVAKLAEEWGISGPGLAKACRRLQIPVPPRGYWAKLEAGQRVKRPQLPSLPPGEGEEVVIHAPGS